MSLAARSVRTGTNPRVRRLGTVELSVNYARVYGALDEAPAPSTSRRRPSAPTRCQARACPRRVCAARLGAGWCGLSLRPGMDSDARPSSMATPRISAATRWRGARNGGAVDRG